MSVTILCVDDEAVVLEMLGMVLRRLGCEMIGAASAESAWTVLDDVTPDAIFVDIAMPGTGGIDFCRDVKANSRLAAVPVIFLTATDDSFDAALAAGSDGYVLKPAPLDKIKAVLRRHLRCALPYALK